MDGAMKVLMVTLQKLNIQTAHDSWHTSYWFTNNDGMNTRFDVLFKDLFSLPKRFEFIYNLKQKISHQHNHLLH